MKALVLSGGSGTRLRPFTYSMAKQLVPVANKPVLLNCLENLRDIGVTETGLIVGGYASEIEDVVGDGSALGLEVTYIHQSAPLGLAHCVALAADFLGDDDFVMYLGDNILADGIEAAATAFREGGADARILVTKVPDPSHYGVAEIDADSRVTALVEKPQQPQSDLAVIGVYFFTNAIHEAVRSLRPSARGELEITDAIQLLVTGGRTVLAHEYHGYWKDTGKIDDLLECNRELLGRLPDDGPPSDGVDSASTVHGQVVIGPGARVIGSVLTGPVLIGAGSVVENSAIGPDVSIGPDCVLKDAGLEHSILLEGVTIDGVRELHGCVIGRWAQVRAPDNDDVRQRLIIGDHTQAEVSA
ncbi:glucose-1-phosphate thymidylyltransferase [Streptomyces gobiensis]|uniref:glucose-1-phosphate thymidylyltransferase n=1 Tax=Streptomyces gobiensis TaxID=2875706 RepID=UPI001E45FC89|nr:glucose-1-phosphate thymidylyltransferase [Streptomyces gobiensis]UGY93015.1 glucose-1-phosphate thymidylyltransferase [Streptomyces gobiensis]